MLQVLMREEFSDLNLVVGRNLIAVHQLVLGAHSSQVALVLLQQNRLAKSEHFWQRDGEYKYSCNLRGFCHYPHRGVDAGRHSCKTTEYKSTESLLPPSFKSNVLRESLSVDSQNIPCVTLKRRGSWVISVYL
jgi:hypothetical protein